MCLVTRTSLANCTKTVTLIDKVQHSVIRGNLFLKKLSWENIWISIQVNNTRHNILQMRISMYKKKQVLNSQSRKTFHLIYFFKLSIVYVIRNVKKSNNFISTANFLVNSKDPCNWWCLVQNHACYFFTYWLTNYPNKKTRHIVGSILTITKTIF